MTAIVILSLIMLIAVGGMFHGIYRVVQSHKVFKYDETNPFRRTCKRCGSHQNQYHTSGYPNDYWWSRMYPIGNDENYICHSFTENRE